MARAYRRSVSGRGRKYYPCLRMLFACLWMSLRGLSQRGLDRALELNSELAHAYGFMEKTPSQTTISRFMIGWGGRHNVSHEAYGNTSSREEDSQDEASGFEPLEAYFRNDPETE
ncbi:MAG: transposase [Nitrososphaerota archaeon]